jgi:perosamine synthetase
LKSLSPKTTVVIPAYTCFSVPAAVMHAGLRPAPCDISPSRFDFDHARLERMLSADTLCVVGHHLFGVPSDIERIRTLCRARQIFVVEDAAQAMGAADFNGRWLGTLGDVGIFSLGRGKSITCGSGGIVMTSSGQIADAIARQYRPLPAASAFENVKDFVQLALMTIFIRPRLYWIPAALPFLRLGQTVFPKRIPLRRLSGMKAGFLRNWRSHLARANRLRSNIAADFRRRLPLRLADVPPRPYLRLPLLATSPAERERIYARSQAQGLGLSVAYPTPVSEIPEMRTAVNGHRFPRPEEWRTAS